MPTKTTTRATLTAKQRACTHPPTHVHPTYDDRWETCDLCHIIRQRPLPAPWIVEWDESQPAPEPPALFAEPTPTPAPAAAARPAKTHAPAATATAAAAIVRETPETFGDMLRAARQDRALLGSEKPWQSPPLDDADAAVCHRCRGIGAVRDHDEITPGYPFPTVRHVHHPNDEPRPCPRCNGAGRIAKYTTR